MCRPVQQLGAIPMRFCTQVSLGLYTVCCVLCAVCCVLCAHPLSSPCPSLSLSFAALRRAQLGLAEVNSTRTTQLSLALLKLQTQRPTRSDRRYGAVQYNDSVQVCFLLIFDVI